MNQNSRPYRAGWILILMVMIMVVGACGETTSPAAAPTIPADDTEVPVEIQTVHVEGSKLVTVGLDWTPNTNHTGVYVAKQGIDHQHDISIDIVQAPEGGSVEQLVAAGQLDFGFSYQESVTHARVEGLPVVSIAAVIQHNDSGFASRESLGIVGPADFAGKTYGAFGSPIEQATISGLMECVGADPKTVEFVDIGSADFFVATERGDIDFAWIFRGWTGIEADIREIPLNIVMINDLRCIPDYYTPVLITSEQMIAERPDTIRRFMAAVSEGYELAIKDPDRAADMLLMSAPELDPTLVRRSQEYLATKYQANAPRWGEQRMEIWRDYAQWMADRNLITSMIDPEAAFTNEFLPE